MISAISFETLECSPDLLSMTLIILQVMHSSLYTSVDENSKPLVAVPKRLSS